MRKTKVPVKSIPAPVEWILKNATGQQLAVMWRIAGDKDFKAFTRLIGLFKDYNVYEVFRSPTMDANELALLRAAKRGEVAGLDALILACQMASDELDSRIKEKKKKKNAI